MNGFHPRCAALAALVSCLVLTSLPVSADPGPGQLRAAVAGQLQGASGNLSEVVEFDSGLVPALLGAHLDRPVRVADWPVAPGLRADVDLTRFDV